MKTKPILLATACAALLAPAAASANRPEEWPCGGPQVQINPIPKIPSQSDPAPSCNTDAPLPGSGDTAAANPGQPPATAPPRQASARRKRHHHAKRAHNSRRARHGRR